MIKYRTGGWGKNLIEVVEVEKETVNSVWLKGSSTRRLKLSGFHNYFNTWEEAKNFLQDQADRKVDSLRRQLEQAKGEQGNIKGMKKS
jgi:hypothetical protein